MYLAFPDWYQVRYIKVKSHKGDPHGRNLTQFPQHEATRSIATPTGWDASPWQGYTQDYAACIHLYTWVERDDVEQSFLSN